MTHAFSFFRGQIAKRLSPCERRGGPKKQSPRNYLSSVRGAAKAARGEIRFEYFLVDKRPRTRGADIA